MSPGVARLIFAGLGTGLRFVARLPLAGGAVLLRWSGACECRARPPANDSGVRR